ncbi:hypothetical protein [Deinococcus hohokamensis]|uniref:Lipoprotein n=1 Tax=Deinococcus hohokamensis TaxID=309883 RepID=A0ABV9ICL7_9DEIO
MKRKLLFLALILAACTRTPTPDPKPVHLIRPVILLPVEPVKP